MRRRILCTLVLSIAAAHGAFASITSTSLRIQGTGLKVVTESVTTEVDVPVTIQTAFGGKQNDEADAPPGLTVAGDLTGPGLDAPITLTTAPGHAFQVPGLPQNGRYVLQNVRLMNGADFLQYGVPSAAIIDVTDVLKPTVTVRQLSPDDLRQRNISVDLRNYDVFEYSFTFLIDGQEVKIDYPVVIDPRTHEVQPAPGEHPYALPPPGLLAPPRWSPPTLIPMEFREDGDFDFGEEPKERASRGSGRSMPAAIVIPNSMAVLHQFSGATSP